MDNTDYSKYKVLIVDDIPVNVLLIKGMLTGMKFKLISANSVNEALEKAASEKPDVILMDVLMPGMNGYDCTRALRANPATAGIPVIIVSALSSDADMKEGLAAGANDFLTKPIIKERIVNCIINQINLSAKSTPKEEDTLGFGDKPMRDGLTALLAYFAGTKQDLLMRSTVQLAAGVPMALIDDSMIDTLNGLRGCTDVETIESTLSTWATQRINSKEVMSKPLPINDCITDALAKFGALLTERNLTTEVSIDEHSRTNTDPELFWAIFVNMMICVCAISSDCTISVNAKTEEGLLTLTLTGKDVAAADQINALNRQMAVVMAEKLNGAVLMDRPGDGTFLYQLIVQA